MSRKNAELVRMYATEEGVSLADPSVERVELEAHTSKGELLRYELEVGATVESEGHLYVPLFRLNDDSRRLEEVLVFRPEAVIMPGEELPFIARAKPRQENVTDDVWREHSNRRIQYYSRIGRFVGRVNNRAITVYKWRQRRQR